MYRDLLLKMPCPHCNRRPSPNKDIHRTVYYLPIGTALCVKINFKTKQGKCYHCGHSKTFLPNEVDEKETATKRLKQITSGLCKYMAAAEVTTILSRSILWAALNTAICLAVR